MREKKQNLAAVGLGLLLSVAVLGSLEAFLRMNRAHAWIDIKAILPQQYGRRLIEAPNWDGVNRNVLRAVSDPFRGIWKKYGERGRLERVPTIFLPPQPGQERGSLHARRVAPDGEIIYDVFYRYNQKERRQTPGQPRDPAASVFLVGCSLVLGDGVQEGETIGAFMQTGLNSTAVESLGYHGWGIGNHLNALRQDIIYNNQPNPYSTLEKRPVVVVYIFIEDHIRRTLCSLSCYQKQNERMLSHPRFEVSAAGEVRSNGRFSDFWAPISLLRVLAESALVTELGLEWPPEDGAGRLKKFFGVLNAYRKELAEKVPVKDFYFVRFAPHSPLTDQAGAMAQANGYKVINLEGVALNEMIGAESRIPFDGHFTPPANYILSQLILHRIRQDHPDLR